MVSIIGLLSYALIIYFIYAAYKTIKPQLPPLSSLFNGILNKTKSTQPENIQAEKAKIRNTTGIVQCPHCRKTIILININ